MRTNANGELWDALTGFGRFLDSTGSSTGATSSTAAAGSTAAITVSLSSGYSTGTYIRIGPVGGSQLNFVTAISTAGALSIRSPLAEAISTGEPVRALARTDIGCPDDSGVQTDITADITTVNAACQRNAYAHLIGYTDASVSVGLLNISWENLQATVGAPESDIGGGGTTSNPSVVYWLADTWDTVKPVHFFANGTLKDGTKVEVQFWDCDIDPSKSMALARGQAVPLGLTFFPRVTAWYKPVA